MSQLGRGHENKLMTDDCKYVFGPEINYWMGPNYQQEAYFKIDMGQPVHFTRFNVKNSNNAAHANR